MLENEISHTYTQNNFKADLLFESSRVETKTRDCAVINFFGRGQKGLAKSLLGRFFSFALIFSGFCEKRLVLGKSDSSAHGSHSSSDPGERPQGHLSGLYA